MKVQKLFQKTRFGIFFLFILISLSTSVLNVYTVSTHLSEEYESNSRGIAKTIADSSVDILLNRDLAALQSLIDQFLEIQGIKYIYITNKEGEFLAHTFVPGIPKEISDSVKDDPSNTETVERSLPDMGSFVEVGSSILAGEAGAVHVGMDTGLIDLKIDHAAKRQMSLFVIVFVAGVLGAIWFVNLAAKPMGDLLAYAAAMARDESPEDKKDILGRRDEVGQLARLFVYCAQGEKAADTIEGRA